MPISNYNLGLKQVPKEYPITYNQEIHNKKSIVEYQKITNREEKMHQMNSILIDLVSPFVNLSRTLILYDFINEPIIQRLLLNNELMSTGSRQQPSPL